MIRPNIFTQIPKLISQHRCVVASHRYLHHFSDYLPIS
ncbi:unnamed protein product, partial [Rotaria sordida]